MTDHDVLVQELLERQVPLRTNAEPDWEDVSARASGAVGRARGPHIVVPVLVVVALLVTGVAIATALDGIPWWESAPPPAEPWAVKELASEPPVVDPATGRILPTPDGSRARTVARDDDASLTAVPLGRDGYCLLPSLRSQPPVDHPCEYQAGDLASVYAQPDLAWPAAWIVYGRFAEPKVAALDLSEAAGTPFVVQLRPGGFFIANVPRSRWATLNRQNGEARLLDASGATLRTGCVSWGPGPGDELVAAHFRGVPLPFWARLGQRRLADRGACESEQRDRAAPAPALRREGQALLRERLVPGSASRERVDSALPAGRSLLPRRLRRGGPRDRACEPRADVGGREAALSTATILVQAG